MRRTPPPVVMSGAGHSGAGAQQSRGAAHSAPTEAARRQPVHAPPTTARRLPFQWASTRAGASSGGDICFQEARGTSRRAVGSTVGRCVPPPLHRSFQCTHPALPLPPPPSQRRPPLSPSYSQAGGGALLPAHNHKVREQELSAVARLPRRSRQAAQAAALGHRALVRRRLVDACARHQSACAAGCFDNRACLHWPRPRQHPLPPSASARSSSSLTLLLLLLWDERLPPIALPAGRLLALAQPLAQAAPAGPAGGTSGDRERGMFCKAANTNPSPSASPAAVNNGTSRGATQPAPGNRRHAALTARPPPATRRRLAAGPRRCC